MESSALFSDFVEFWFKAYCERSKLRPNTVRGYRNNFYNHIIPVIGDYRLDCITPDIIDEVFFKMSDDGLSDTSQLYVYRNLYSIFTFAVNRRIVSYNPVDGVIPPKRTNTVMHVIPVGDLPDYVRYLLSIDIEHALPAFLALFLGVRRGEALGLKWSDIDFKKKTVFIQRTATPAKGGYEFTPCKTSKSQRHIMIPEILYRILCEWKTIQEMDYGVIQDYVFGKRDGRLMSVTTFLKYFKQTLEDSGLPNIRYHDLRHTYATFLVNSGVTIDVVSQILGHANLSTTLDVYVTPDFSNQTQAISKLDSLLN